MAPSATAVFLSLLFLLSLSHARDLQTATTEPKPESQSEPLTKPQQHDTVSFTINSVDPVPLTLLRFRPINRHFPPLSLRSGHRRCRHGRPRQIPYGNDMIHIADADAASQIRPRWVTVHSSATVKPRPYATVDAHEFSREHRHHRHYHHHVREESWFAKKIRKFLNLF
ncbi:hypothetical protein Fmac_026805 [Flemingia macrophylla]|uniref:Uncharacterized protein n=1 Tax=Flemingia macrophylla TaxID=520843 RepID=A0ABD1LG16_9FABA